MTETGKRRAKASVRAGPEQTPRTRRPLSQLDIGPGQPLEESTRTEMEARFGAEFGGVRIHTGATAAAAAERLNADAYTVGQHIVFGSGRYAPQSSGGVRLLAHELAHTVQQRGGGTGPPAVRPGGGADRSADRAAAAVARGRDVTTPLGTTGVGVARQFRSVNYLALDDYRLEQEVQLVRSRLDEPVSYPERDADQKYLRELEAEVARRNHVSRPPPAPKKRKPPLPKVSESDSARLMRAMRAVASIKASTVASNSYSAVIDGESVELTQEQVDRVRATARNALKSSIIRVRGTAAGAAKSYREQTQRNKDQWIVSSIVKAVAEVRTLGDFHDPGPILLALAGGAQAAANKAQQAAESGDFITAARLLADAESAATRAQKMFHAYWQGLISAGEFTVTTLTYTRNAAGATLAVLAIVATGGAAAAPTTTLFGASVSTTSLATGIAIGAPIVQEFAVAGVRYNLGEDVDWGRTGVNALFSIVTGKLGGKLGGSLFKSLAGRLPKGMTSQMFARATSEVVVGRGSAALSTVVNAVYDKARGRDVTWKQLLDDVWAQLTDPKGLLADAALGAVQARYGAKPAPTQSAGPKTPATPAPRPSAPTAATPKSPAPKAPPPPPAKQATPAPSRPATAVTRTPTAAKRPTAPRSPATKSPGATTQHQPKTTPGSGPRAKTTAPKAVAKAGGARPPRPSGSAAKAPSATKPTSRTKPATRAKAKPAAAKKKAGDAAPTPKTRAGTKPKRSTKPAKKKPPSKRRRGRKKLSSAERKRRRQARAAANAKLPDISERFTPGGGRTKNGRYVELSGELGVPGAVRKHRSQSAQRKVSKGKGDDAGHLIGARFGAPPGGKNLGLQNWRANRFGTYKKLENRWARQLKRGVRVKVTVREVTRHGESRPYMREVRWTEIHPNGRVVAHEPVRFANTHTPQSRAKQNVPPTVSEPQTNNVIRGPQRWFDAAAAKAAAQAPKTGTYRDARGRLRDRATGRFVRDPQNAAAAPKPAAAKPTPAARAKASSAANAATQSRAKQTSAPAGRAERPAAAKPKTPPATQPKATTDKPKRRRRKPQSETPRPVVPQSTNQSRDGGGGGGGGGGGRRPPRKPAPTRTAHASRDGVRWNEVRPLSPDRVHRRGAPQRPSPRKPANTKRTDESQTAADFLEQQLKAKGIDPAELDAVQTAPGRGGGLGTSHGAKGISAEEQGRRFFSFSNKPGARLNDRGSSRADPGRHEVILEPDAHGRLRPVGGGELTSRQLEQAQQQYDAMRARLERPKPDRGEE